jgi:hypothetical protein
MKKYSVLFILFYISTVNCTPEIEDCCASPCGNGVAEIDKGEQCDYGDFSNKTCAELTNGGLSGGQLICNEFCMIDTSNCREIECGDGFIDSGEDCEGTNLNRNTCDSANSDYQKDVGELSCNNCKFDFNFCVHDCSETSIQYYTCDISDPYSCCDHNGSPTVCSPFSPGEEPMCFQTCTSQSDCGWDRFCVQDSLEMGDICHKPICGSYDSDLNYASGELNFPCSFADYNGTCVVDRWEYKYKLEGGICRQNGTLEHGESCIEDQEDVMNVDPHTQCNAGECIMDKCLQYCNPDLELEGIKGCPGNTNCVEYAYLTYDTYFLRSLVSFCKEVGTSPTCNTVTGKLLDGTGIDDCGSDVCKPGIIPDSYESTRLLGTLIGRCTIVSNPLNPGDECAVDQVTAKDLCPGGHACIISDFQNDSRTCVKACDKSATPDSCIAPKTCVSVSILENPNHEIPTFMTDSGLVYDIPNRLGFCVEIQ